MVEDDLNFAPERPPEAIVSAAAGLAPAAWIVSLAAHLALVAAFLDRTGPLPSPPEPIEVEVVLDAPLVEALAVPVGADQFLEPAPQEPAALESKKSVALAAVAVADLPPVSPSALVPVAASAVPQERVSVDAPEARQPPPPPIAASADPTMGAPRHGAGARGCAGAGSTTGAIIQEPAERRARGKPSDVGLSRRRRHGGPARRPRLRNTAAAGTASTSAADRKLRRAGDALARRFGGSGRAAERIERGAVRGAGKSGRCAADRGRGGAGARGGLCRKRRAHCVPQSRPFDRPDPAEGRGRAGDAAASRARPNPVRSRPRRPRRAASGFDCSKVHVAVDEDLRSVSLSGHIRSEDDRDRLAQMIAALGDVPNLSLGDLHVVGEPVLPRAGVPGAAGALTLRRSGARCRNDRRIRSGRRAQAHGRDARCNCAWKPELLELPLCRLLHRGRKGLSPLPGATATRNAASPGRGILIGGPGGRGLKATIGPPFGLDMVVALASEKPLFRAARPTAETAEEHLNALTAAVAAAHRSEPRLRLEYSYFLVRTAAR